MPRTPPPAERPDLGRLRIERPAGRRAGRARGLPWVGILGVVAVAGLLWLFRAPLLGLFGGPAARSVRTALAVRVAPGEAAAGDVTANGYIVADRTASLATPLSGRLVSLLADVGDPVVEGAEVARIFSDDLAALEAEAQAAQGVAEALAAQAQAAVDTATAAVAEARAALAARRLQGPRVEAERAAREAGLDQLKAAALRAAREVERQRPLFEAGRLDGSAFDALVTAAGEAEAAVRAAGHARDAQEALLASWRGDVEQAQASVATALAREQEAQRAAEAARQAVERAARAVASAGVQLDKTIIRAPFSGVVIRKDAEVGEVLAPMGAGNSRGSVLTIADPASYGVQVELTERRILQVHEAARATVFLDAEPDRGWAGRVTQIWPRGDRSKGTIEVRVTFDVRPPYARPDMGARVVFHAAGAAPAAEAQAWLGVPADAVVGRGVDTAVWIVEAGRLVRRRIVVGEHRADQVEVREGLAGGETVVRRPASDLQEGETVVTGSGS